MKSRRISSYLLPIITGSVGLALCVVILFAWSPNYPLSESLAPIPQCAHWSIFRVAQLLGIPTAPGEIQRLLPHQTKGHSMVQVVETLAKIGLKAEGYRHDWNSLAEQHFPCIVHLEKPDHYVVVSGIESERDYVHIFDDAGNRTRWQRETFEKRWTGYTLHVQKDSVFFTAQIDDSKPYAMFDHLFLDKGDIPAVGEPVEFVFPIYNVGKDDLIVEDVKVNCGCLKSEKPNLPIRPGESGVVKLFYSIEPKRGVFTQTAAVKTNDPNNPVVVISACGFTGVEVRIEPSRIILDRLFLNREFAYRCFVHYTGEWNDFSVELVSTELTGAKLVRHEFLPLDRVDFSSTLFSKQQSTKIPDSVGRNNRVLELTFEPTGTLAENVGGTIILKTNVPGYERFTLQVSGTVKSPVQPFPSLVAFDDDKESTIALVSLVDKPFEIIGVDCDLAVKCQYDKGMQQEQQLRFGQNGVPQSMSCIIRYRLDKEQTIGDLPLTLLNNDQ